VFCSPNCAAVQLAAGGFHCHISLVDDKDWRATYADLLKQIRAMQRQLARAQEEAKIVREHAAHERARLKSVRTERRAVDRYSNTTTPSEFATYRNRRKKH
jgi:uncharacterized protein (DUF3084 family)